MCESGMFGTLIRKVSEAELSYPTKPLEFGGVDQVNQQPTLGNRGVDLDYVVYGIPIISR